MDEIQQRLEALRDELTRHAAVRAVEVSRDVQYNAPAGHWSVKLRLHRRKGRQWVLTDDEVAMDPQCVEEWLQRIRDETALLCTVDAAAEQFTIVARAAHALAEQRFRDLRQQIPRIWPANRVSTPAMRKARELFIKTLGMETYQVLNNGGELLVTGSSGTPYVMTKRASFCLRNTRTGVEYCAVVPGVPLWDHLLGVKLMVEHDEPRLLAIANSSLGLLRTLRA